MNTETQIITKMIYSQAVCNNLKLYKEATVAIPTIDWMLERSEDIIKEICINTPAKTAMSWARVADRAVENIRSLKDESIFDTPDSHELAEELLFTISVLTQMLEDISLSQKAQLVEDLQVGAYTLEELLCLPAKKRNEAILMREDEIRLHAKSFLEKIYQKMGEI